MAKVMRSLSAKSVMASPFTLATTRTAWAEAQAGGQDEDDGEQGAKERREH